MQKHITFDIAQKYGCYYCSHVIVVGTNNKCFFCPFVKCEYEEDFKEKKFSDYLLDFPDEDIK